MNHYIDGFAFPILKSKVDTYKEIVEKVADIWKEYGALNYQEYVSEGSPMEGTLSFDQVLQANSDECIIFGWLTFDSKEARNIAHEKVASDKRMNDLIQPLLITDHPIFDAKKMAFGGFRSLIEK